MKKYIIISLGIVGVVFLLNFKLGFWKTTFKNKTNNSIEYFTIKSTDRDFGEIACGLYATFNGKKYEIINCEEDGISCILLDTILDFDGDGLNDALIEDLSDGCGSAYIPSSYFICSPDKNMNFRTTDNFGDNGYGEATFEKWKGKVSILKHSWSGGMGGTDMSETIERFILKNGKALRVENTVKKPLRAIHELTSAKVSESEGEHDFIVVNLDTDNLKDTIFGEYWMRWGVINWRIGFGNGKSFDGGDEGSKKRVGVLSSKTNGINDLVLDFDEILIWNGEKYIKKNK